MENLDVSLIEKTKIFWRENKLELDVYLIDLQHLWLLYLINKLEKIINEQKEKNEINSVVTKEIIEEFIEYTIIHFTAEEFLIKSSNFPEIDKHLNEHIMFIQKIKAYNNPSFYENLDNLIKLKVFLNSWLTHHISIEDKKLFYYYKKNINVNNFFQDKILEGEINLNKNVQEFYKLLSYFETEKALSDILIHNVSIIWSRYNLRTGIPLIDLQHLWLIYLIVQLDDFSNIEDQSKRLTFYRNVLDDLMIYISEHFETEENVMEIIGFKNLAQHKLSHQLFIKEVLKMKSEFDAGNLRTSDIISAKLIKLLKDWLFSHIVIHDKEFAKVCLPKSKEVSEYSKKHISEKKLHLKSQQFILYKSITAHNSYIKTKND